jgi:hypothetical protein
MVYFTKKAVIFSRLLKTKKPRASVCPRLKIKLDDPSTHGQTPPVEIKIKILPGLIDMISNGCHNYSSL